MKRFAGVAGAVLLLLLSGAPLRAQSAAVVVETENFRTQPQGSILARLQEGTPLVLGEARGRWRQATFEAWIYGRSVRPQRAGELDVVVNAGGENLRASPNGALLGRANGGMRLDRVESRDGWLRVRRTGWIWAPSVQLLEGDSAEGGGAAEGANKAEGTNSADAAAALGSPAASGGGKGGPLTAGEQSALVGAVLDSPQGDTVARLRPGARVRVLAREGDWTRVRIEGWARTSALVDPDSAAGPVLADIPRDSVQADPDRFRGRLVEWTLQFVALQEAERFRTDFLEGEPFVLARGPDDDAGFVYLAVPPEQQHAVSRLAPLETIRVLGRVRTARSALTGAPVLDLVELIRR